METFCFLVVGCISVKALVLLYDLCWAIINPNLTTVCAWCYWNLLYGGQWWTAIALLLEVRELYLRPYRDIEAPLCWLVLWLYYYLTLLTNLSILETVGTDEMSFWMSKKSLPQRWNSYNLVASGWKFHVIVCFLPSSEYPVLFWLLLHSLFVSPCSTSNFFFPSVLSSSFP